MEKVKGLCSACKYFNCLNDEIGECRRTSPRWASKLQDCFPRVSPRTWCGSYKDGIENQPQKNIIDLPLVKVGVRK